jgi:ParB family chromosome partitioning protein
MVDEKKKENRYDTIPIDKIDIGKWNVRTLDRDKKIEELKESISEYDLLQPVVVYEKQGRYKLIIGQRRLLAFKELKRENIPAIIIKEQDEEKSKILSLSENIHRVELNRADIVEVISYLYRNHNKSAKKVANLLGIHVSTVYDYLKIQDAPEEVREILSKNGKIIKADVKRVMELVPDNKEEMIKLAKEFKKLTPPEKIRAVEIKRRKPETKPEDAIKEAKKPYTEEKVIVPLTPALMIALDKAVKEVGLSREEIAKKALEDWLGNKGYYR